MRGYGLLQVYTGTGKGKTTAALGVALRAAGRNAKVYIIQYMKDDCAYGEFTAVKYLPNVTLQQVGRDSFVNFQNPDPIDVQLLKEGWNLAKQKLLSQEYDILILDEINVALAYNMLSVTEVAAFIKENKGHTEVICTGRGAPQELLDCADLVTDMNNVKHYFFAGVSSRDGIDH